MIAGAGVFATGTIWPDIAVAFVIAALFMHSSIKITLQAISEYREGNEND
jgi:divalent metal cation (Fe/Co/Zn/Cd) transporter